MKHLHTGQFKQVYKEVKTPLPHVNFLILGFLVWLEQHYLDYTIKSNIDSAIKDYLKNDKNLWSLYTTSAGRKFPHCYKLLHNMDVLTGWVPIYDSSRCGQPVTIITTRTHLVRMRLSSVCEHLLAFQFCDSNNMCGTGEISWQSQNGTAIIKA